MSNGSFKRGVIIALCAVIAAIGGYCFLRSADKVNDIEDSICRHMAKSDPSTEVLQLFPQQEFDNYLFVGFEYSSNDGYGLACAIFFSPEAEKMSLFNIIPQRKFHRYATGIFEKTIDLPTADAEGVIGYRLILNNRSDLAELISIDQRDHLRRYSIDDTPCLIVLTDVNTKRQFIDANGAIISPQ